MDFRSLASVRRVKSIESIPNADSIELAQVDGWQCVVKKGEFKEGDLGVYFEIDSLLPCDNPVFSFLEKNGRKRNADGREGYRLRTIKLRGTMSQGLLLPTAYFGPWISSLAEGSDITDLLNVVKYEPPLPAELAGQVKGLFPSFLKKTDEERIQNLLEYFTLYKDRSFEVTEKLDGSSMTVFFNNGEFGVCSRNYELKYSKTNSYWDIVEKLNIEKVLRMLGANMALQGELVGEGVQGNPLKIVGRKLFIFNIWDIDSQLYLLPDKRETVYRGLKDLVNINSSVNISSMFTHVPILGYAKIFSEFNTIEKLLDYTAKVKSLVNSNCIREGLVFKSVDSPSVSFKAISNVYLLGEKG